MGDARRRRGALTLGIHGTSASMTTMRSAVVEQGMWIEAVVQGMVGRQTKIARRVGDDRQRKPLGDPARALLVLRHAAQAGGDQQRPLGLDQPVGEARR